MNKKAEEAVAEVREKRMSIQAFEDEYEGLITEYHRLASDYNSSVVKAKNTIRAAEEDGTGASYGDGWLRIIQDRSTYDPEVVFQEEPQALLEPGVIKSIDKKKFEAYVATGVISARVANKARVESLSVTVRGPKTFELSL
jgi:hypothetical protein